ncbi:hypothetical protein ACS8Y6_15020 [Salinisphaera sp. RV14]|uniref:hypothetical protein n=1 Tax=Salinisphaera sp. RV14 TaxID=3454140 RepID=UPI003F82DB91
MRATSSGSVSPPNRRRGSRAITRKPEKMRPNPTTRARFDVAPAERLAAQRRDCRGTGNGCATPRASALIAHGLKHSAIEYAWV